MSTGIRGPSIEDPLTCAGDDGGTLDPLRPQQNRGAEEGDLHPHSLLELGPHASELLVLGP